MGSYAVLHYDHGTPDLVGEIVVNWDDSVAQISASEEGPTLKSGRKWFWIPGLPPVPVLGAGGAGKTELWRLLTGGSAEDQLSSNVDEKYYFGETKGRKSPAFPLVTVPAQLGDGRRDAEEVLFKNATTAITGVIFVACYGYNFIWPKVVGTVDHEFSDFSTAGLSDRNINKEVERFEETCELIQGKWNMGPDKNCPKWLLVICNKVDLYWDEIDTAKGYYSDGCGSDFDSIAGSLTGNLAGSGFTYHVLPAAMTSRVYLYQSTRGTLRVEPTLKQPQCDASLNALVDKLGELCGR
jgi:hypothetical protein